MRYYLYNFILETDICFEMLTECRMEIQEDDNVILLFVNEELEEDPEIILPFKEDITYYLCPRDNKIYVKTKNLKYLYSSLFNIPMSLFSLFKGKAIIHCNAIEFDSALYCFSGNKGIGKTTLAMFLEKYCSIFSDDCVAVDMDCNNLLYGYRAAHTLKLCKTTFDIVMSDRRYEDYFDDISQKASISLPNMDYKRLPIKKMFFLIRGEDKRFVCDKVESVIVKRVLLIQAIVGKDYIPKSVIEIFGHTRLFDEIVERIPFFIVKNPPMSEYNLQIPQFLNTIIEEGARIW